MRHRAFAFGCLLLLFIVGCASSAQVVRPQPDDSDGVTRTTIESTEDSESNERQPPQPLTRDDQPEISVAGAQVFREVYVSPSGNDEADGATPSTAVRSFAVALEKLEAGGTVFFAAGQHDPIRIEGVNATSAQPLVITAQTGAVFIDSDYRSGAGVLVENSSYIELRGFSVRRALWGIYIDNSHHVEVSNVDIADVGQEALRVKGGSSNITIRGNTIADTGRRTDQGPANGEGIYLGTGTPSGVDHVRDVLIEGNTILRTTDEAIDIKRPVTNVQVVGNTIRDIVTQTSGAIVVHLNGDQGGDPEILVARNRLVNVTKSSPYRDGNCIVTQVTTTIVNNVLDGCQHRGIYVRGNAGTVSAHHNTFLNMGEGAIVDEGRGASIDGRNNLGAGSSFGHELAGVELDDVSRGRYGPSSDSIPSVFSASPIGVGEDLSGQSRLNTPTVTFGAVQVDVASPEETTTPNPVASASSTAETPTAQSSASPTTVVDPSASTAVAPNASADASSIPEALGFTADTTEDTGSRLFGDLGQSDPRSCLQTIECAWAPFL